MTTTDSIRTIREALAFFIQNWEDPNLDERNLMQEALEALDHLAKQVEWQPIDKIPEDRQILGIQMFEDGHTPMFVMWRDQKTLWMAACGHVRPTHWMPLPLPPQPQVRQEGGE